MATTIEAIDKAIDDSFLWGQINIFSYVLGLPEQPPGAYFMLLLKKKDGFERRRDELFWKYTGWCFAHNVAVACLANAVDHHFNARLGFDDE